MRVGLRRMRAVPARELDVFMRKKVERQTSDSIAHRGMGAIKKGFGWEEEATRPLLKTAAEAVKRMGSVSAL